MPKSKTVTPRAARARRAAWRHGRRSRRRPSRRCRSRRRGSAARTRPGLSLDSTGLHLARLEEQVTAGLAKQLLAGVVVDGDRDVGAVLVVDVEALDRRRTAVEHPVVDVAVGPGRRTTLAPLRKSPRARALLARVRVARLRRGAGSGGSGGLAAAAPRAPRRRMPPARSGREARTPPRGSPRRRVRSSPARPGPVGRSPRARRRRAPARAAAGPPRSRCCRTGCRGSRGRSAVVGEHDRRRRAPRRRRRGEHRQVLMLAAASTARRPIPSRSSGETKRPASASTRRSREQARDKSRGALEPGIDLGRVVDALAGDTEPVGVPVGPGLAATRYVSACS